MQEQRLIELLMDLHRDIPRQGPGERNATLKALGMCAGLPQVPDILDVGCGSGTQTLYLAEACKGRITAVDVYPPFLDQLRAAMKAKGLEERVRVLQADMGDLPLPPGCCDLLWCEGAVFIVGFDQGLTLWRDLLRPGGCMVLSELVWHTADPSPEPKAFFQACYPVMRDVPANLAACRKAGYEVLGHFTLAPRGWSEEYFAPLKAKLPAFRQAHAAEADALEIADRADKERELFGRFNHEYGYEFFVLRRAD